MDEKEALVYAIEAAKQSPCQKSKRGVVIFSRQGQRPFGTGCNRPPGPYACTGNTACRRECSKICVHAEQDALLKAGCVVACEMLHIIIDDQGKPVSSGHPSCWQCSRLILAAGITTMWLYRDGGLVNYSALSFHDTTLDYCALPRVLR